MEERVIRKVSWHRPFRGTLLLRLLSRPVKVGFAALTMNAYLALAPPRRTSKLRGMARA
jgi:hypothetical protein